MSKVVGQGTVLHYSHADTNAANEPCGSQHAKVDGSDLQSRADEEDARSEEERPFSRDFVGNPALIHGAEKCTKFNHGRQQALSETGAGVGGINLRELVKELRHDQSDGNDALTEEVSASVDAKMQRVLTRNQRVYHPGWQRRQRRGRIER